MTARFSLRRQNRRRQDQQGTVEGDDTLVVEDEEGRYGPDPTVLYDPKNYVPSDAHVPEYGVPDGGVLDGGVPEMEDDESWLAPDTRRRVKMAVPTFLLVALVVIAGAFWGGAEVDKHFGNNNNVTAANLASALGRRATGGTGGSTTGGFGGLGGAGGGAFAGGGFAGGGFGVTPAAEGTVSAISGDILTVTSTTGGKIKVALTSSTIVTRTGEGSTGPIRVGDTVRVQGTKASDGTVTASSVTATAAGVSAGRGFAGLGAAGGGSAGGAGGAATGSGAGGSTTRTTVHNGGFSGDGSGVSG